MASAKATVPPKPGYMTTEFWSHLIVTAMGILAGLHAIPDGLPARYSMVVQAAGLLMAAIASGVYALSRSKAKAGAGMGDANLVSDLIGHLKTINPTAAETYVTKLLEEITSVPPPPPTNVGRATTSRKRE